MDHRDVIIEEDAEGAVIQPGTPLGVSSLVNPLLSLHAASTTQTLSSGILASELIFLLLQLLAMFCRCDGCRGGCSNYFWKFHLQ